MTDRPKGKPSWHIRCFLHTPIANTFQMYSEHPLSPLTLCSPASARTSGMTFNQVIAFSLPPAKPLSTWHRSQEPLSFCASANLCQSFSTLQEAAQPSLPALKAKCTAPLRSSPGPPCARFYSCCCQPGNPSPPFLPRKTVPTP